MAHDWQITLQITVRRGMKLHGRGMEEWIMDKICQRHGKDCRAVALVQENLRTFREQDELKDWFDVQDRFILNGDEFNYGN
jgi:hypothetical protein